jgi:hypothetical protein
MLVLLFNTLGTAAALETTTASIDRIPDPGNGLSALLMVLAPASVALREELDISDLQFRSLQDLKKSFMKRSMEISRKMVSQPDNSENPVAGAMKEKRIALEELFKSLEKLLRPEQFRRLRQIHFQYSTLSLSLEPLARSAVMTELDLSPDDQIRFAREVKSRGDDLKKTNIELNESVSKTLDSLVTVEQRQKLNELLGEPVRTIEFSSFTAGSSSNSTSGKGISRLFDRVRDPGGRKELELVKDQDDQLSALYADNRREERRILSKRERERVQAVPRGLPQIGPPDKELEALREQYDMKVAEILLPHQVKRLGQLDFQLRVRAESHIPLLSRTAAIAIGLTDEKQSELQEAYLRESAVVRQEKNRLYHEALNELIGSLSIDQQKRYHLLVGKQFDKWYE